MKAEALKNRPDYKLLKKSDNLKFHHLQLPRWLIDNEPYNKMSLEAKFIYTLLLNRFQVSQLNGWVNGEDEVFIIYTRKELSVKLNTGEKRVSSAMTELKNAKLIWEKRCGRGFANQIYLADTQMLMAPEQTTDETEPAIPNIAEEPRGNTESFPQSDAYLSTDNDGVINNSTETSVTVIHEQPYPLFKNGQYGGSKKAVSAVHEPLMQPPSKNNLFSLITDTINQSHSMSGRNEEWELQALMKRAELEHFSENEAKVMGFAIERLYFMQSIKVNNAIFPNARIRSHLWTIDALVVQDALHRVRTNTQKITSSIAYVTTVLFNTIMEYEADLIVDPYLNYLSGLQSQGNKQSELRGG